MAALSRSARQLHGLRSSTSIQQHISPKFLQLPASIRSRAFHASPRLHLIEESIQLSHTLLQTLHSTTGLPWVYTLPLFAVAVRTTIVLPLAIYSRRVGQRQISLQPIIQSWTHSLRKETIKEVGHQGPVASQAMLLTKQRSKRIEIYRRWGCQTWKNFLPILQLPVFLSIMESIREMCGTHQGFLSMMMRKDPETNAVAPLLDVDSSLASEGALWFPNLLMADPHLVLPFVLSGTILLNIFGYKLRGELGNKGVVSKRIERILGTIALFIGPIMMQIPSGLLIYWIGSSFSAFVQATCVDVFMPIKKPVQPCRPKNPWKTGLGAEIMGAKEDVEEPRTTSPEAIVPVPKTLVNRRHRS